MIRLVAIAKDECSALLEWISFHLACGFDSIHVYDNGSEDCSEELIADISRKYPQVKFVDWTWPRLVPEESPQCSCYAHAVRQAVREGVSYIAFFDLDEFLALTTVGRVSDLLSAVEYPDRLGLVWFNIHGYDRGYSDDPLLERDDHGAFGGYVKSLVRPEQIVGFSGVGSTHLPPISPGGRSVLGDGSFITDRKTKTTVDAPAYLAHYVYKSEEEFALRVGRGRVVMQDGRPKVSLRYRSADASALKPRPISGALRQKYRRVYAELKAELDYNRRFQPSITHHVRLGAMNGLRLLKAHDIEPRQLGLETLARGFEDEQQPSETELRGLFYSRRMKSHSRHIVYGFEASLATWAEDIDLIVVDSSRAACKRPCPENFQLNCVDLGEVDDWGKPIQSFEEFQAARYVEAPWETLRGSPSVSVLVQGRFRRACSYYALTRHDRRVEVIVQDYFRRPQLADVTQFGKLIFRNGFDAVLVNDGAVHFDEQRYRELLKDYM